MSAWTQIQIEDCIKACNEKAAIDAAFRAKLMADPIAAAQELCGKEIPQGIKIKVIESDANYDYTFVLPELLSGTVGDGSLDDVVGGSSCGTYGEGKGKCNAQGVCTNYTGGGYQGKG